MAEEKTRYVCPERVITFSNCVRLLVKINILVLSGGGDITEVKIERPKWGVGLLRVHIEINVK